MKHLTLVMVMMITSTFTFSQKIGKVQIGLPLDETIEQCKSAKYELVDQKEEFVKFLIPNCDGEYDLDTRLMLFASPKSKIVWFGVMTLESMNKKEAKLTFLSTIRTTIQKKGVPYKKRRNSMKWDMGSSVVYIERDGLMVKYTVINTQAFSKVKEEL